MLRAPSLRFQVGVVRYITPKLLKFLVCHIHIAAPMQHRYMMIIFLDVTELVFFCCRDAAETLVIIRPFAAAALVGLATPACCLLLVLELVMMM